jgi:dienelactone hydrolase
MRGRHAIVQLRRRTKLAILGMATVALCATATTVATTSASAATNPYQRGPDPTVASISAVQGPYATASTTVASGNGFGGGTIYYPTSTADGTFGAVVLAPGFVENQSVVGWLGPRLASQGFVVFTINTNSGFDDPPTRATEILAAVDWLTTKSSAVSRIDASRVAIGGHSMGGGGTLLASRSRPSLKAAIPLEPWTNDRTLGTDKVPTLMFAAQNDVVAPVSLYATPLYNAIPASTPKGYLEFAGADHFVSNSANVTVAKYAISWLKRFVDNDTRYTQFLCPAPTDSSLSKVLGTCTT